VPANVQGGEVKVYVVTMTALFDQGCAGVFSTKAAAVAHAEAMIADSDHHHDFRVDEMVVDSPVWLSGRWFVVPGRVRDRTPEVTFVEWGEAR
jgi:hypothetical protein